MNWESIETMPLKRKNYLKQWLPEVHFKIVSQLHEVEYRNFLNRLISDFVRFVDPENKYPQFTLNQESGQEGKIACFHIDGEFINHCKLDWFDDNPRASQYLKSGLLFSDHGGIQNIYKVYKIADAFEKFLIVKKIGFTRSGFRRKKPAIKVQAKYPDKKRTNIPSPLL